MRAALGDGPTGTMLAGGVAAALYARERTGRGTTVEASLLQGAMWTLAPDLTATALTGRDDTSRPPTSSFGPLLGAYLTADDRWLQLTMPDAKWWVPACRALGLDALADDPRFREGDGLADHDEELRRTFSEVIRARPHAEIVERLREADCVVASFASLEDVLADPQVEPNGFLRDHPTHPTARLVPSPVQFAGDPVAIRRPAPRLGQHSIEVLTEAGFSPAEIDTLLRSDVTVQCTA